MTGNKSYHLNDFPNFPNLIKRMTSDKRCSYISQSGKVYVTASTPQEASERITEDLLEQAREALLDSDEEQLQPSTVNDPGKDQHVNARNIDLDITKDQVNTVNHHETNNTLAANITAGGSGLARAQIASTPPETPVNYQQGVGSTDAGGSGAELGAGTAMSGGRQTSQAAMGAGLGQGPGQHLGQGPGFQQMFTPEQMQYLQQIMSLQLGGLTSRQSSLPQTFTSEVAIKPTINHQVPTPKFANAGNYERYLEQVKLWRECKVALGCQQRDLAIMLLQELPDTDRFGGLQGKVYNELTMSKIACEDGIDNIIKVLDRYLKKADFLKSVSWMKKWDNLVQKEGMPMDVYINTVYSLADKAKQDHNMVIPQLMLATKMMIGVRELTSEQLAMITSNISLEGRDGDKVAEKVETQLRKFSNTMSMTAGGSNKVFYTNLFKERTESMASDDSCEGVFNTNAKIIKPPHPDKTQKWKSEGKCTECGSSRHKREFCERFTKRMLESKKRVEARGGVWLSPSAHAKKMEEQRKEKPTTGVHLAQTLRDHQRDQQRLQDHRRRHEQADDRSELDKILSSHAEDDLFQSDGGNFNCYLTQVDDDVINVMFATIAKLMAMLDSGCGKSCSGTKWNDKFLNSLSPEDRAAVRTFPGSSRFKFGSGTVYTSTMLVVAPIYIGGRRYRVAYDVLPVENLPLLLSLFVMQKLEMTISYSNKKEDIATVRGTKVKIHTADGHQWLNITKEMSDQDILELPSTPAADQINEVLTAEANQVMATFKAAITPGNEFIEIKKVHTNLAHLSKERLISVLKMTNSWNSNMETIIDKVLAECPDLRCRQRGQVQTVPKATFRQARVLGDMVGIDLKIYNTGNLKNVLYIVDYATNFLVATTINNKTGQEITKKFMQSWFGHSLPRPKVIISDNGLEFSNSQVRSMCSQFNIVHVFTAPYTPASNGKVERCHALVDLNFQKLQEQFPKLDQDTLLSWAVWAYNQSETRSGFSPAQIVHGFKDDLVSVCDMTPTEAQDWNEYAVVTQIMAARCQALENHIQAKNSQALRNLILRKSVPSPTPKNMGDWVWVKRPEGYAGPGQISAITGNKVKVTYGNQLLDAGMNDLILATKQDMDRFKAVMHPDQCPDEFVGNVEIFYPRSDQKTFTNIQLFAGSRTETFVPPDNDQRHQLHGDDDEVTPDHHDEVIPDHHDEEHSQVRNEDLSSNSGSCPSSSPPEPDNVEEQPRPGVPQSGEEITDSDQVDNPDDGSLNQSAAPLEESAASHQSQDCSTQQQHLTGQSTSKTSQDNVSSHCPDSPDLNQGNPDIHDETGKTNSEIASTADSCKFSKFKKGLKVMIKIKRNKKQTQAEWEEAVIYSKNRKSNSNSYNYQLKGNKTLLSSNFDNIEWKYVDEDHHNVNITHEVMAVVIPWSQHGRHDVKEAKDKEFNQLKSFNTFEEIQESSLTPQQAERIIPSSWVITEKGDVNELFVKARLVARGDLEPDNGIRTDSPTASRQAMRIFLSYAASSNWIINAIDFSNAFVQGVPLDREVFMRLPPDYRKKKPGVVLKLKKCLYGLRDASRRWNLRLDSELKKLGMKVSYMDRSLYLYFDKHGNLAGIGLLWVDDLVYAGTSEFHDIIRKLSATFTVGKFESQKFCFTGWNLQQDKDGITLTQSKFQQQMDVERFQDLKKPQGYDNHEEVNDELQQLFRKGLGVLQWLSHNSKPHLGFYATYFASVVMKATSKDCKMLYKILDKAKSDNTIIRFSNLGNPKDWKLVTLTDASFAHSVSKISVSADITMLMGKGKVNIIDWQAQKISIPPLSSLSAESTAALAGYNKIHNCRFLIKEITGVKKMPAIIMTDNKSLEQAVHSTSVPQDRKIFATIATIRQMNEEENIQIKWIPSTKQWANPLTKIGANSDGLIHLMKTGDLDIEF